MRDSRLRGALHEDCGGRGTLMLLQPQLRFVSRFSLYRQMWGKTAANATMREHNDEVLKKLPGMIVGLCECDAHAEMVLRSGGWDGDENAPKGTLANRDAFEYIAIRGNEGKSNCIGLRVDSGSCLQLLYWHSPTPHSTHADVRLTLTWSIHCMTLEAAEPQ